jgi:hypothetical protein
MKVAIALLLFAVLAHNADGQAVDDPIASAVRPYVADHQIGGAVVLVGTKDKVLDEQVAGYADVATKTPMRRRRCTSARIRRPYRRAIRS